MFFGICSLIPLSFFFFSSRRRHTISLCDWSSDVCSSDLLGHRPPALVAGEARGSRRPHLVDQAVVGDQGLGPPRPGGPPERRRPTLPGQLALQGPLGVEAARGRVAEGAAVQEPPHAGGG